MQVPPRAGGVSVLSPGSYVIQAFSLTETQPGLCGGGSEGWVLSPGNQALSQIFRDVVVVVVDLPGMGVVPWQLGVCLTADYHWSFQARPHRDERGFDKIGYILDGMGLEIRQTPCMSLDKFYVALHAGKFKLVSSYEAQRLASYLTVIILMLFSWPVSLSVITWPNSWLHGGKVTATIFLRNSSFPAIGN